MPPDCYKVEVLHLLNPHLIWVEVRDSAFKPIDHNGVKFEQIGIYGVLPLETTIDLDDEEVTVQKCKEWLPASATLTRKFLADADVVLFTPIHLDRRSSIFDDNIHKFGDLHITKKNGKTKSMSNMLSTSGFATYDACLFHQYLSEGKINTKLSNIETQKVLTELEKYFINNNVPKNKWEKPILKHTSVSRVSYELEEALSKTNVEKHNKNMKSVIENKKKDFELCKGIDEPSLGRATTRKEKKKATPVEKKLEILHSYKSKNDSIDTVTLKNKAYEHLQAFEDTKIYLEAHATPYSKKISSKTDAHKTQILKKVMSKTALRKISKQEKLVNKLLTESKENIKMSEAVVRKQNNQTNDLCSSSSHTSISESEHCDIRKAEDRNHVIETDKTVPSNSTQPQNVLVNEDVAEMSFNSDNKESKEKIESISKVDQEQSVNVDNIVVLSLKENQKQASKESNNREHKQYSSKGQTNKKKAKAEVKTVELQSQEPLSLRKNGEQPRSTSPEQKLAYPPQNTKRDQESQNSRRVPEIPNDCEIFATKPVSEYMVKKLMHTFKLTGSKHSDMIQNAIRKCKDGAKNNADAIAALLECRNKIIDEIKELDDPNNLTNVNLEIPLSETVSKTKLKRRGKKHNMISVKAKSVFGPPGIDLNTLTRVPPVVLYDKEVSKEGQNPEVSKRLDSLGDEDFTVKSVENKNGGPSCSNKYKTVTENAKMQENHMRNWNENKDTTSSSSSLWEKRLKLHKEMAKNKRSASHTSDSTNKDSSNVDESIPTKNFNHKSTYDDSDESMSEIIEKLSISNNNFASHNAKKDAENAVNTSQEIAIKANPFQNFDLNNSVFVDNLVTPIMMVHSKMNKRFVPVSSYGDVHFSEHIRLVLKNLRIDRPMMIQSVTWNAILRGHSVFMIGSAFSGKTMGYLPAVCRLLTDFNQSDSYCDSVGPFCIIVCATSQSVTEIERISKMLVGCDEKVVACYYGHDEMAIATSLLNGCDLLICTAPSLVRLLQMPEFGVDLQRLSTFVLEDCERLSEAYSTELKFCLCKVKEMLKVRVNKELLVQYIVASRIWCDFMEPFAKKAPGTVVCIGAFQECVLYAKANMTVSYVEKKNKLNQLFKFLKDIDPSKRTVVVCDTDEEVHYLSSALKDSKYFIFSSNSSMTVQDLYNLSILWKEFSEPLMAPILICCDANLYHMNIINASYLVQYSMPSLYSMFCRRFAALIESYPSLFKTDNQQIRILILLEENNVSQFPKIVNFVKRCTDSVPDFLNDICTTVLAEKDAKKAEIFAPLCNTLMSLGTCPDLYNCNHRHTILKGYDKPKEWMPKSGTVTFKILHFQNAAHYSARLIANFDAGNHKKYPPSYSSISLKIGIHYSNNKNRILLGVPKVGDICAVASRNNLFCRGQVIKIINRYERGNPKNVLVNLLDEEIMEIASDTNLYHLPDDLKGLDTYVVHVRLANIQPRDKDIVFSELARDHVQREAKDLQKGMYMRGNIVLTVSNCIFIDTLEACQDLKSLNETVVMYNVKRELLEKHAEINPDHTNKIKALLKRAELVITPTENKVTEVVPSGKTLPEVSWAHLGEKMSLVEFGCIENPDVLFVRLAKFDDCMKILIKDILKYVTDNTTKIEEVVKDDIVLAEYPDDGMYERARIDEIEDEKIKCFFVDQGEWRHLKKNKIMPISNTLITQLPFQAIECRLVGIKPPGEQWTDFASNWLFDKCAETACGDMKQLYVKYFTKESAQFTGGHKYGIVVIDTYGKEDAILNQEMIDLNLAIEVEDELQFLDPIIINKKQDVKYDEEEDEGESWEKLSKFSTYTDTLTKSAPNVLLARPIRSVPLIGTDDESDDLDKWNINMTDDMAAMFKPLMENFSRNTKPKLRALNSNESDILEGVEIVSTSKNLEECSRQFEHVKIYNDSSKELDSDDLSSPENCASVVEALEIATKPIVLEESQFRKPKLHWKQTKTLVTIKIQLIGVENYDLIIEDRALLFNAVVNDTNYSFEFDLYGVIDKKNATHCNKGQYILVKLNKIMSKNWLTLTKDGGIRKWIVYDIEALDTSSDEEELPNDVNLFNIMKSIHNTADSDSDDEFVDDVSFGRKNDD